MPRSRRLGAAVAAVTLAAGTAALLPVRPEMSLPSPIRRCLVPALPAAAAVVR